MWKREGDVEEGRGRGRGKGTLIKISTFRKESNGGNDTLFTIRVLLKEFFE
jgi:hypothetical protein